MAEINLQPIRDKMMEELKVLEKTCENCEYEHEDPEGTHCRHCIHSAEEHFKQKEIHATEQEIRNKAIDELVSVAMERFTALDLSDILGTVTSCKIILRDIAEQMKGE